MKPENKHATYWLYCFQTIASGGNNRSACALSSAICVASTALEISRISDVLCWWFGGSTLSAKHSCSAAVAAILCAIQCTIKYADYLYLTTLPGCILRYTTAGFAISTLSLGLLAVWCAHACQHWSMRIRGGTALDDANISYHGKQDVLY